MSASGPLRGSRGLVLTATLSLVLLVVGLVLVMGREGPVRLGDNGRVGTAVGGFLDPGHRTTCTRLGSVPDGTRTARVSAFIADGAGKPVPDTTVMAATSATVQVPGGRRTRAALRADGQNLSIALPAGAAREGTRLCLRQAKTPVYAVSIRGVGPDPLAKDAAFGVVYEQARAESWWSRAGSIADHVPVPRPANQGGWTLWTGLGLMGIAALGGLGTALAALAGRLGHGRRAVVAVALVGVCSAGSWAFLSPPLQTPDSESHLSYIAYLAEHGRPPSTDKGEVSSALGAAQAYTREPSVRLVSEARPPFTQDAAGPRPASSVPDDDGGVVPNARNNPILYYAVAAVPYKLSGAGPFGGELLVRLLSALMFGVTVAGVLLFLRELLPGAPRLAAVGALLVALLPQAAFISGSVNPDALLFAVSSLLLWRLARAFRRGLSVRDGVVLGLLLAAAAVSKLAGLMLVPGVAIAVVVLLWRRRRGDDAVSLRGIGALALAFVAPFVLYQLANTVLWSQSTTGGNAAGTLGSGSIMEELSYMWQFFLPRLPSMSPQFVGSPVQDVYLLQFVGSFGWNDTRFLPWVYDWGRPLLIVIGALALVGLGTRHRAVRGRAGELLAYLAILGAFLVLIAHLGYQYRQDLGLNAGTGGFEQVRYLFPLLGFYAAVVVVALRLFGRRLAPHLAIVLVAVAALHSSTGVLTILGRFYG